jgi:hypothetical protein
MGVEILSMKLDFLGGFSLASRLELTSLGLTLCSVTAIDAAAAVHLSNNKATEIRITSTLQLYKKPLCSFLGAAEDLLEARLDRPREVPFRPCLESHVSAPPRSPLCAPDRPSLVGCHVR